MKNFNKLVTVLNEYKPSSTRSCMYLLMLKRIYHEHKSYASKKSFYAKIKMLKIASFKEAYCFLFFTFFIFNFLNSFLDQFHQLIIGSKLLTDKLIPF